MHAQLLLCLSGGKSLSTALRRFGVSSQTRRLLVVVLPLSAAIGGDDAVATATAPAPPRKPADAPTANAAAATTSSPSAPPLPPPPPPTAVTAFDGIVGVEVADVVAGLAVGAASRAVGTAAAYKISAEELSAGGGGEGVAAIVNAIATRVATREVVAK